MPVTSSSPPVIPLPAGLLPPQQQHHQQQQHHHHHHHHHQEEEEDCCSSMEASRTTAPTAANSYSAANANANANAIAIAIARRAVSMDNLNVVAAAQAPPHQQQRRRRFSWEEETTEGADTGEEDGQFTRVNTLKSRFSFNPPASKRGSTTTTTTTSKSSKSVSSLKQKVAGMLVWMLRHPMTMNYSLYGSVIFTTLFFAAAVGDQATYSSDRSCLLGVTNYHLGDNGIYTFNTDSKICGASVVIGTIGILIATAILLTNRYYIQHAHTQHRSKRTTFAILGACIVWALVVFIMVSVASSGLSQTCSQFVRSGADCWYIFSAGFFDNTDVFLYRKSSAMIRTGIAFGWFACISWLCAAGYEVLLVKRHEHWVTRFIMKYGNRRNRDGDLLGDGNAMKSTTTTSTSSLNGQQYELLARRDTSATAVTATNANTLARQGGRTGKDDEEDEGVAVVVVENSKV